MVISEEKFRGIVKNIVTEAVRNLFESYGCGSITIGMEDIVDRVDDEQIKQELYEYDGYDEFKYVYEIKFCGRVTKTKATYDTPGYTDIDSVEISDDDGLLDDINKVKDERFRTALIAGYKKLVDSIESGDYDDEIDTDEYWDY